MAILLLGTWNLEDKKKNENIPSEERERPSERGNIHYK